MARRRSDVRVLLLIVAMAAISGALWSIVGRPPAMTTRFALAWIPLVLMCAGCERLARGAADRVVGELRGEPLLDAREERQRARSGERGHVLRRGGHAPTSPTCRATMPPASRR